MPAAYWFKREKIEESMAKGEILIETIDRNVLRVLRQKFAFWANFADFSLEGKN